MKLYPFLIVAFLLIVGSCSDKTIRVGDEFLSEMSEEEIRQMERIEKTIVTISDEQQSIRDFLDITELELQIHKQEAVQLEEEKSILTNKERLHKVKNDPLKQNEVQQAIQYNNDQLTLNGLKHLALKARLAYEKAQLEAKNADLGERISKRSLMRAQITRVRQGEVFGNDSGRSGEKIDVSVFEERFEKKQLALQKKENLRLEAGNRYQEARSALNQKLLRMPAPQLSPVKVEVTDELIAESASPSAIPTLIHVTQLEIQITQQEKKQLQRKSSILIDRKRLANLENNSIEQKEIQLDIERTAKEIHNQGLLTKALEARLVYENTLAEKQKVVLEQKNAENVLIQAKVKRKQQDEALGDDPKKQGDKIDLSTFENQLEKVQSRLQKIEKSLLDERERYKMAFNEWKGAQSKLDHV